MSEEQNKEARIWGFTPREFIALTVSIMAMGSLVGLAIVAICNSGNASFVNVKDILSLVMPILATWMGTVLAFYFSKENFKAASDSMQKMVNTVVTSQQKLLSIKVIDVMIPVVQMKYYTLPADKPIGELKITDLTAYMDTNGINRLPILNKELVYQHLIHRSTFDSFIARKAQAEDGKLDMDKLTFGQMLEEKEFGEVIKGACGFVAETANLCDAQDSMKGSRHCSDIIVTKTGHANEPVTGWITNNDIAEKARV